MEERPEFRELHVLIVGCKAHHAQTLRTTLGVAGVRFVTAVADSVAALELLQHQKFGAVFCDEHAKPIEHVPFFVAARRRHGVLNPMIPIFLVSTGPRKKLVEHVRDHGVSDVIVRPMTAATIGRKLRIALEMPRRFIKAGEFFGPDRRAARRQDFKGKDRRQRGTRPMPIDHKDSILL